MNYNIPSRMELPIKDIELDEYYGKDDNDDILTEDELLVDEDEYIYEQ